MRKVMKLDTIGLILLCVGVATAALGTMAYGVATGDIVSISTSGGKYGTELSWCSRQEAPQEFWVTAGVHAVVGSFMGWIASRIARDKHE
jgi:hypothetical protein